MSTLIDLYFVIYAVIFCIVDAVLALCNSVRSMYYSYNHIPAHTHTIISCFLFRILWMFLSEIDEVTLVKS